MEVGGMTVQCIDCRLAGQREKAPAAMASAGFACCALRRNGGTFVSLTWIRECEHFAPAPDAVAKARREWLESRR